MPIYEYQCQKCHDTVEIFQKISDPTPQTCPNCDEVGSLHKTISKSAFHLKGGGWYKDLYSSKKTEAKTDTKTKNKSTKTNKKDIKKN